MGEPITDRTIQLIGCTDAQVWAKTWLFVLESNPDIATDEGTMISWFANAIMAGHDGAVRDDRTFIVEKLKHVGLDEDQWVDVGKIKATDAGAAFHALVIRNPTHRIEATTYRISEEALILNVSINLEAVDG